MPYLYTNITLNFIYRAQPAYGVIYQLNYFVLSDRSDYDLMANFSRSDRVGLRLGLTNQEGIKQKHQFRGDLIQVMQI